MVRKCKDSEISYKNPISANFTIFQKYIILNALLFLAEVVVVEPD